MLSPIVSWPSSARAAVGRFHDRRPAARADHEMALAFLVAAAAAGEPRKLARDIVIMRLGLQPLGDRALLVVGRGGDQRVGHVRRRNPRRAVEDEGRADLGFVEQQLGLQQLELEADRPQDPRAAGTRCPGRRACRPRSRSAGSTGHARRRGRRPWRSGRCAWAGGWVMRRRTSGKPWQRHAASARRPFARPSRSAASRTSRRPAPRTAAASRSAANRLRG